MNQIVRKHVGDRAKLNTNLENCAFPWFVLYNSQWSRKRSVKQSIRTLLSAICYHILHANTIQKQRSFWQNDKN